MRVSLLGLSECKADGGRDGREESRAMRLSRKVEEPCLYCRPVCRDARYDVRGAWRPFIRGKALLALRDQQSGRGVRSASAGNLSAGQPVAEPHRGAYGRDGIEHRRSGEQRVQAVQSSEAVPRQRFPSLIHLPALADRWNDLVLKQIEERFRAAGLQSACRLT